MLQVGLTGGIGSGKSTVARRLLERGAVLVDSDVLAREVVAAGTPGLAEVVAAFGEQVVAPGGELDRSALASVVFGDAAARERLNGIVHPRIRERSAEIVAAAPADAVLVHDIPLLVEGGMGALFALVLVVHADAEERVRRLVEQRGLSESDARARIAAQADDAARRTAADVWLDNGGAPGALSPVLDGLWDERLRPFEENLRLRRPVDPPAPRLVEPDPGWSAAAQRLAARVARAAGEWGRGVAHIGSTAVPGLPAKDVIDLQLAVASIADADAVRDALQDAGFVARPEVDRANAGRPGPPKRFHGTADPGRPVHLHVREEDSPAWRAGLLLRDWLRADPAARAEYLQVKREAEAEAGGDLGRYVTAKGPWFPAVAPRVDEWAVSSGWAPSLG